VTQSDVGKQILMAETKSDRTSQPANGDKLVRIPVTFLYFDIDRKMPGGFYGGVVTCNGTTHQKHWRCDYIPRMQMYELTFHPAPGTKEATVTTYIPREWARYE
jgi:hypothetical protein